MQLNAKLDVKQSDLLYHSRSPSKCLSLLGLPRGIEPLFQPREDDGSLRSSLWNVVSEALDYAALRVLEFDPRSAFGVVLALMPELVERDISTKMENFGNLSLWATDEGLDRLLEEQAIDVMA
jgi:hypothetical protein